VCIAKADQDKKEPCVKNVSLFKWGVKSGEEGRKREEKRIRGVAKVKRRIKGVFLVEVSY